MNNTEKNKDVPRMITIEDKQFVIHIMPSHLISVELYRDRWEDNVVISTTRGQIKTTMDETDSKRLMDQINYQLSRLEPGRHSDPVRVVEDTKFLGIGF